MQKCSATSSPLQKRFCWKNYRESNAQGLTIRVFKDYKSAPPNSPAESAQLKEKRMDGEFPTAPRSPSDLESEITELTGHLNAATHRWRALVAEFDTRKGGVGAGTQSCAH